MIWVFKPNFLNPPTNAYLFCNFLFERAQHLKIYFWTRPNFNNNVLKRSPQASTIKIHIISNHRGQLMLIIYNLRVPLYHVSASSILPSLEPVCYFKRAAVRDDAERDFFHPKTSYFRALNVVERWNIWNRINLLRAFNEKGCEREEKHVGYTNREYSYFPIHDGNRFVLPQSSVNLTQYSSQLPLIIFN